MTGAWTAHILWDLFSLFSTCSLYSFFIQDAPATHFPAFVRLEEDIHNIACTSDGGRHGSATLLAHQDCSVPVRDSQVVVSTVSKILRFKVEGTELQYQHLPLRCWQCLCLLIVWIIIPRVVWRADNSTCGKNLKDIISLLWWHFWPHLSTISLLLILTFPPLLFKSIHVVSPLPAPLCKALRARSPVSPHQQVCTLYTQTGI